MAHSEEFSWCEIFLESIIVGMTMAPDLTDNAMILIVLWELSVGVNDLSINAEAKTHWICLVPRPCCFPEHVLVERPVLRGGDQGVGVTAPRDVGGHISVLEEGGEGDVWPLDVPDIDSKVDTERAAAEVVRPLWPPLDAPHRADGVDSVLQAVHLVPPPAVA